MKFTFRTRQAFITLDPGEVQQYWLPPTTPGAINIDVLFQPGFTQAPAKHGFVAPAASAAGGMARKTVFGTVSGSRSISAPQVLLQQPQDDGDPDLPGAGKTNDLILKLILGGRTFASGERDGIHFDSPFDAPSWVLEVKRKAEGSLDRRTYQIIVGYPTILPLEERRIPLAFLRQGFDANWNDGHQYLEDFAIDDNVLTYRWDRDFALLYDLEPEGRIDLGLPDSVTLPTIRKSAGLRFGVDADHLPFVGPTPPFPFEPYFAMDIKARCDGSTEIDIPGPFNPELPQEFWITLKFYLNAANGGFYFEPKIRTSLTVEGVVIEFLSLLDVDLLDDLVSGIEGSLRRQMRDAAGRHIADKHLKPWFVGNYEVSSLYYDHTTGDIVVEYVGTPIARPPAMADQPAAAASASGLRLPPLFLAPREVWPVTGGIDPGDFLPVHTTTPGALAKIEHIVVLMQENRSFDQVLGYLSRDGGLAGVEGLLPGNNDRDTNRFDRPGDPGWDPVFRSRPVTDTSWPFALDEPAHGHSEVAKQIADGMKHFVANYARRLGDGASRIALQRVMDYYAEGALPAYSALAREFAICDHWFCSHIGGTLPNRHVTLSGDLNRDPQGTPEEENSDLATYCPSERKNLFDHLTERGVSWRVFEHGYSFLRLYRNYTFDLRNIVGFSNFEAAAEAGTLPSVSFIEPDYIELPGGNDDHAPADMFDGQQLVARVARALIRGKKWKSTLLIVTYDEHGGFYDHVFPPDRISETQADGSVATRPIPPLANGARQLGPRVPAFVISPLIARSEQGVNTCKRVFEHSSIAATIVRCFCSPRPPSMGNRIKQAADLRELLTLSSLRPVEEFGPLLEKLDAVVATPRPALLAAVPKPRLLRKALRGSPGDGEDFKGFMAYASSLTGRGRS